MDMDTEMESVDLVTEISRDNMRCKKFGKVKLTKENYNQKGNVTFETLNMREKVSSLKIFHVKKNKKKIIYSMV